MSGIVLSASVRQNLLSLQSTASLLATTQNDLATGNKVNSALDNPTNFFTAQSLNNRASDINNLLDGIGNGVQVLQAANTGITSLQSLVASAQSIANQVLQTPVGYSTKSNVTSGRHHRRDRDQPARSRAPDNTVTGTAVINDGRRPSRPPRWLPRRTSDDADRASPTVDTSSSTARPSPSDTGDRPRVRPPTTRGNVTIDVGTGSTATVRPAYRDRHASPVRPSPRPFERLPSLP